MVTAAARKAARKAIKSKYEGVCTIIERRDTRDEKTKITHKSEITVIKNQPCRLSFESLNTTSQTETAAVISQGTKLFLPPEIVVRAGSKIVVEQEGRKNEYSASGEPAVYATHQEIKLELFRGWA